MGHLLINLALLVKRPTGISTYALNLLPALARLNPWLLSARPYDNLPWHPVSEALSPDRGLVGHGRRLWWTQTQLPSIYQRLGASLSFSPEAEAPLFSACRSVVTVHDLIPLRFPRLTPLWPYNRFYKPAVIRQAVHVICNSQATANEVMERFQIPARRLTPIPLGYDAAHFRPQAGPTANYFLYLGRPDPHKNLFRLIQAFSRQPKDLELWIAGGFDRRHTPQAQQLVGELGLATRVRWLSYVPYADLPHLLGQALALVFPSLWEGFGLPVLEAMACGTPVITSRAGALPEVAGEAALLVDPYAVGALAEAMQQVAQSPQLRFELRQRGILRAGEFSWAKTGAATADILEQYL
jgi:glycosyltransferase involved in cell wall biosynthesis